MTAPSTTPTDGNLVEEFEAALAWWNAAGVDQDFSDDATDWLADAEPASAPSANAAPPAIKKKVAPPPPPPPKIGGEKDSWPTDLAGFQHWWVNNSSIDEGGAFPVIGPAGDAGAQLMVIVAEPEESDVETLLSGPHGNLLAGMMRAANISAGEIYTASVLRRHTPMPDWQALTSSGIGDLTLHHVKLAAPKRILTFGRNIPPLFGNDTAQGGAILQNVNHEGRSIPSMGVGSLSDLLRSAGRRQRFWQRWLEWTE